MVTFPNCKINLGLRILNKRNDGFHNIETIFYPIPLKESLEIIETENELQFSTSGIPLPEQSENNLCIKAFNLLKKDFSNLPAVKIHLHKNIPIGAGLGGGSADAAFTLTLLNQKFNLQLTADKLKYYAAQIGSDCSFFIDNSPCFATGKGEILEKLNLDFSGYKILLIHPGIHVATSVAYSIVQSSVPKISVKTIIQQPIETWKENLINDFEIPIFKIYPELKKIKKNLYNAGAIYASMSGSGSAMFGIFGKDLLINISLPENYFKKELPLFLI